MLAETFSTFIVYRFLIFDFWLEKSQYKLEK